MRVLVVFLGLLVIAGAVFGLSRGGQRPADMASARGQGSSASGSAAHLLQAVGSGEVVDADGEPIAKAGFPAKKLTFIYFSANWCAPCHRFTPDLVKFYQDAGDARPFNLIMVSEDQSEAQLKDYATSTHMPWSFAKLKSDLAASLEHDYAGEGIPDLVLVDDQGKVLADSFDGHAYRGPQAVLDDYDKMPR